MARAYIVLARQDMDGQLLQILDLKPNKSQAIPAYNPLPQTHYKTFLPQNDTVDINGGLFVGDTYGVAAYLMDHVDDNGAAMSETEANDAADDILDAVAAGGALTSAAVGAILEGVGCQAGTLLDGNGSTGTIEELLQILAGAVFRVDDGSAEQGNTGYFVRRPSVTVDVPGGGGRKSTTRAPTTVTQGLNQDTAFRDIPRILDVGELRLSALSGNLYQLAQDTYVFNNPSETYDAGGSALDVGGARIGSDYAARAVTVYDASGNVIV